MTTVNHALWGATFGRLVGMPIPGAIAGSMPDLLSIPILAVYHLQGKKKSSQVPKWAYNWYAFLHNWILALLFVILLYLLNPLFVFLGIAYFWHAIEDGIFHTDYATRILYPFWKGKIQLYSASEHKWIQVVDLILILLVNVLISVYKL